MKKGVTQLLFKSLKAFVSTLCSEVHNNLLGRMESNQRKLKTEGVFELLALVVKNVLVIYSVK